MIGADQAALNTVRNLFVLSVLCQVTEVDILRRWESGVRCTGLRARRRGPGVPG